MQGPLPHREVVEESGLAIGRSASSGVSVCILPAGIHHMRHVVRQTDCGHARPGRPRAPDWDVAVPEMPSI